MSQKGDEFKLSVAGKQVPVDMEQTVGLKKRKAAAKSAVTKTKNRLLASLDLEFPDRKNIRDAIQQLCSLQSKAINAIYELATVYKKVGDLENFEKASHEISVVEEDCEDAVHQAELFLRNTFDTSSVHTIATGIANLFEPGQTNSTVDSRYARCDKSETAMSANRYDRSISQSMHSNVPNPNICDQKAESMSGKFKGTSGKIPQSRENHSQAKQIGNDLWKQLRRVSIPVFSGNIKEYEGWRAAFMACVDRAPATNEYKLLQLKQYLSGEAAQLVSKLGHTAAVYSIALERLERKYGGKRRQIALHLEEVSNFKPVRPGNSKDLDKYADMLDVVDVCLREGDKPEELGDGCLYAMLLKKLTESMIQSYKHWVVEHQRQESVETLREWVMLETEIQTAAHEVKQGFFSKSKPEHAKSGTYFGASKFNGKSISCSICNGPNHPVWKCSAFKLLDVHKRWDKARELGLCFRCLSGKHRGKSCARTVLCGIDGCDANHNRLLHDTKATSEVAYTDPHVEKPSTQSKGTGVGISTQTTMSSLKNASSFVALRTVPVVLRNKNRKMVVNALLDDASTQTYLNEDVASELGLTGQRTTVSVNVLNNKTESFNSMSVECVLESIDGSLKTEVVALTTKKVTGNLKVLDWNKHRQRWHHLRDISFPKVSSRPVIDILIGLDYLELHQSKGDVYGDVGEPTARLTPLGWTCVAKMTDGSGGQSKGDCFTCIGQNSLFEGSLETIVQKLWEVDEIKSDKKSMSVDEKSAVDSVQKSLMFDNGRYKVGIPWKDDTDELPDNYEMALNRLLSVEKKLSKDKAVSEAYSDVISQYLEKGYVYKVSDVDIKDTKWYLPHFPVIKPDRTTTKVRIVFDASAKCKGLSLNECIYQGPKLQNDLFEILIRFRRFPIAIICDIAEMYLQIEINEKDRSHFRFLWRSMDQNKPPDVYEFSRLVFGVNCAPFIAQFVSQEHAKTYTEMYPLAAKVVCDSTYMDDNMDSMEDEKTAKELCGQLSELWTDAGMHARKWMSNSLNVLDQIPQHDRLNEIDICLDTLPTVKTLGLTWNPAEDLFRFSSSVREADSVVTKRNFLKQSAKIFDPLGFLAPFSIRAKVILQQMWIAGLDWDDTVDSDLAEKASTWIHELEFLDSVQFSRSIKFISKVTTLHVFVDASQDAYGAVIYAVSNENGTVSSELVASKNRVAPIKAISIPRMEMMAAVLGVRLLLAVAKALQTEVHKAILWTDSMNVLWWIRNQSRSFKTFIANRIGYIQEHTNPKQWHHVTSQSNSADVLTRGCSVRSLSDETWLHGPKFLLSDNKLTDDGNIELEVPEQTEKKKRTSPSAVTFMSQAESDWILDPSRFSDWKRLCRTYAWVLRFLHNTRSTVDERKSGALDVEELEDAETKNLVSAQMEAFPTEYAALVEEKQLPMSSKILALKPFLDENGLVRSSGRLRFAEVLSYDARCPIILPKGNPVTKLIVKDYHERCLHMGTNRVLASISSRFWIVAAREEIRRWEQQCSKCRLDKAKPTHQLMADLPKVRVKASLRAFEQVGVDFAGPFVTIQGRGKQRQKRYLCLFTCLSTRAVHLEMAYGLDSDSFLRAFFRMTGRRGVPKYVISDNGTNFVGAVKEMKGLIKDLNSDHVRSSLANKGILWQFNPPNAPHFGDVFESMIKAAKRAIFAILNSGLVNDEELMSAFIGAENLINSRPLTYQSAHPDDLLPLTPNHFLHGTMGGELAPEIDKSQTNPNARWRRVQELVRHVWSRWMREWLPSLNVRRKWFVPVRDIQVGDVVIVVSPDNPRASWPLARVTETYAGKDGHIRVVQVQIGKTKLTRPVTKICPLEWN